MIDPVCGMTVEPASAAAKLDHAGKTYYFCSEHCAHAFQQDPARYLSGTHKPAMPRHATVSAQSIGRKGAKDPVCGMTVDPAKAAGKHEHKGKTYYFCSKGCLDKFKAHPENYLGAKPAPAAKPGVQYTCPMHPEIVQIGPGSCPKCGMALVPMEGAEQDDTELRDMTRRFRASAVLSLPLVLLAMAPMFGLARPLGLSPDVRGYVEFLLGTPVVLWGGWPFFHKFWLSLENKSPNMYTLIGLGIGLAYVYSVFAIFAPELFPHEFREHGGTVGTYFEAAAVIVTLVLLGEVMQLRAMGQTSQAIRQLLALAPNTALRIENGIEREVPLTEVRAGEWQAIRRGGARRAGYTQRVGRQWCRLLARRWLGR